jgi:hypothetical protein
MVIVYALKVVSECSARSGWQQSMSTLLKPPKNQNASFAISRHTVVVAHTVLGTANSTTSTVLCHTRGPSNQLTGAATAGMTTKQIQTVAACSSQGTLTGTKTSKHRDGFLGRCIAQAPHTAACRRQCSQSSGGCRTHKQPPL